MNQKVGASSSATATKIVDNYSKVFIRALEELGENRNARKKTEIKKEPSKVASGKK